MIKIRNQLATATGLIVGIVGHYYGSKLLEYRETMATARDQNLKNQAAIEDIGAVKSKLNELSEQSNSIIEQMKSLVNAKNVSESKIQIAADKLDVSKLQCDTVKYILEKGSEQVTSEYYSLAYKAALRCQEAQTEAIKAIKSVIDDINKNSLFGGLDNFYNYLNSLNLLELSALFNILVLILICLLVTNIIIVLLSNKIIDYFKLEEKYPKISNLLKLRIKFQNYYLVLNFSSLIIIVIAAIIINALVLI
jgi:hypothetical protein